MKMRAASGPSPIAEAETWIAVRPIVYKSAG
jgi:hypothetical protein